MDPGEVEITFGIRRTDQLYERMTGSVDTDAEVCLLPRSLMDKVEYRFSEQRSEIIVDQAGIAKQSFRATEGFVTIILEDKFGNITQPFETRVWFAETDIALIGFDGVLSNAILHIDMPQLSGWLEIDK
jgi:hypothetical protein